MSHLLAVTGALNLGGGIAKVNRLMIYAFCSKNLPIEVVSLCEEEVPSCSNYPCITRYEVHKGNKVKFARALWKKVLTGKIDLVIFDHINVASVLAPLAVAGLVKYVVWVHGSEVVDPFPDFEGRLGLKHARKRIANSQYTRNLVIDRFPAIAVDVCPLGLDVEFSRKVQKYQVDHLNPIFLTSVDGTQKQIGSFAILCVGRMDSEQRYKGQDVLLNSFPEVVFKCPQAQLILVGGGNDYGYYVNIANSLPEHCKSNIFLTGFIQNDLLMRLYQQCFLFALPSTGEGFGLVYLEAMAFGKPCLAGSLDGSISAVEDGKTGILLRDPKSKDELSEKILFLMNHPEMTKELGENGRRKSQEIFSPEQFSERFLSLLKV